MNIQDASPMTRRIIRAGELFASLHLTASALFELYDREDDGELNDVQPASVPKCLPMSLDAWACELSACVDDWRQLGLDQLAHESAAKEQARAQWIARGFVWEFPGYWARYSESGAWVGVSGVDGEGGPDETGFCVTANDSDGATVLDMRSNNESAPLGLEGAIATAIAAVESLPPPVE